MALVDELYQFFEISTLAESATLLDVINSIVNIGLAVWLTMFITSCLFMATNISKRRFL